MECRTLVRLARIRVGKCVSAKPRESLGQGSEIFMFCLKMPVLVATNMTADGRTPDHKSQKFGNKHVMLRVLTVGFTASDDVMC